MKTAMLALGACLIAVLVFAGPNEELDTVASYGYSVAVEPDEEFPDFIRCGISIFNLDTESNLSNFPALRIASGDHNAMNIVMEDGVEVTFSCSVNEDMTEATYEIAGHFDDRLVINHLASIRLN